MTACGRAVGSVYVRTLGPVAGSGDEAWVP